MKHYIRRRVGQAELESLVMLAEAEEKRFFSDNPHLKRPYRKRLIAAALCQGAALQYLGLDMASMILMSISSTARTPRSYASLALSSGFAQPLGRLRTFRSISFGR
jgi:hypothetical protein